MKINKDNSQEYDWGQNCKGWHLLSTQQLSVIQEIIPPGSSEVLHKHYKSRQFFYVLSGEATFVVDERASVIKAFEGIYIASGVKHRVKNEAEVDLEFLVISQPHAHGDKQVL